MRNYMEELFKQFGNDMPVLPKMSADERYERKRREQEKAERFNAEKGDLPYFDCPKCKNKGGMLIVKYVDDYDDYIPFWRDCDCMKIRRSRQLADDSGLKKMQKNYTFENYSTDTQWQENVKKSALEYSKEKSAWFYIGGQSGSGKTHICTAIASKHLEQGKAVRYFLWRENGTRLKNLLSSDFGRYEQEINEYKNVDILFIDDMFKAGKIKNELSVTAGDINLAFEILNYRYNNKLKTIISSELLTTELKDIDESLAGRIYEMTQHDKYALNINRSDATNLRWTK